MNKPAMMGEAHEGLGFATLLRDRLECGVILIDGEKHVTALTATASRFLGWGPEPGTLPSFEALPAAIQTLVHETLSSGQATADQQIDFKPDDRGAVTLRISAVPIRAGGKESGIVVVLNDLTPARQLEERLAQLDSASGCGASSR